ncbi:serine protease FAM111A-like [Genypterus blacodes]|uniref:serine protease FAM111A-like n=1 Tax=Genypterus blacodes TaxID=154954 RepID=UPI003F774D77
MDLKTTNTDNQTDTPNLPTSSQPGEQVAEPPVAHTVPHTFKWHTNGNTPIKITCDTHGGVEDSMKRSQQYKAVAKKNKSKELVIVRKGSAISSDFPCCLIQPGECLTVKYIKAADKPVKRLGGRHRASRKGPPDKLVTFHIETSGGPNVKNVLSNNALKIGMNELTVFGFKGEKKMFFNEVVKAMKAQNHPKVSNIQNLFREEFGKNDQSCREVKTMKKLMELSNSVCQVRVNGRPEGSGFLLVKGFVLTNFHVMESAYDQHQGLHEEVTVHFSFESLDPVTEIGAEVMEVVAFEYEKNGSGPELDWALLKLGADHSVCDGLLSHFGVLPPSSGICIIGHPGGGVKQIDPCYVIPPESRRRAVEQYSEKYTEEVRIQLITPTFFKNVAENVQLQQVLTYDTCFYHGSSGSPVFDEYCNVVAMHSAGYTYTTKEGPIKSVIEYGYPLSHIMERILIQVMSKGRSDVLEEFNSCKNPQYSRVMEKVKEQSRTVTAPNDANWNAAPNDANRNATFGELSLHERNSQSTAMEID